MPAPDMDMSAGYVQIVQTFDQKFSSETEFTDMQTVLDKKQLETHYCL